MLMMRWLIAYCVDAAIADRLNDSDDAIIDRVFVNEMMRSLIAYFRKRARSETKD